MEMRKIVYDLTEVLRASTGKLRYYGIARVTAEVGMELKKASPDIRFCVHSPSFNSFFEVKPEVLSDGRVALNVPLGIAERSVRPRDLSSGGMLRRFIMKTVGYLMASRGCRDWKNAKLPLEVINLDQAIFVTCARPRLILDQIETIRSHGWDSKIVPLLYDMIPLHDLQDRGKSTFSSNFRLDNVDVISAAAMVLAISNFTKNDIISFSANGVLPKLPPVVAVPLVHECPAGTEQSERAIPNETYILTVGAATGRKNLEAIFDAYLNLQKGNFYVPVCVLAGAPRKRTIKALSSAKYSTIRDRFVIYANPNQTDLVKLYDGALALVIGSRMEGWGLPAGEALWQGTPTICSTAPVFREVCGDLGLYFNPDKPDELAAHITRLIQDVSFKSELRDRIKTAKPLLRTWKHVADDFLAALETL
jgi:glycosyltransferase involved in cell wall biosynthesis